VKTIEIDQQVFDYLAKEAIPFEETTPNMVLRRLLKIDGKSSEPPQEVKVEVVQSKADNGDPLKRFIRRYKKYDPTDKPAIQELHNQTEYVHPAFLTFLMDKYKNSHGNFRTSDILPFMDSVHLRPLASHYRNPWMKRPYGGEKNGAMSCQRTIEHFRQTRKFGCWGGRDTKKDCDAYDTCIYHPNHPDTIKNKCDLRKGVIWKRQLPDDPSSYGANYLEVVDRELLKGRGMPLLPLLAVFYPNATYETALLNMFKSDFNLNDEEMRLFQYPV